MLQVLLWRVLTGLSLVMGGIGVVLPGIPTVPFLLLAAWAGGRGWPEMEARLLAHPRHGPVIRQWREHRAVPRRAKWLATGMMLLSAVMIQLSAAPLLLKTLLPMFLLCVGIWLWSRPEARPET